MKLKIYSRALKHYSDDYVLYQRKYEQDLEIIKIQIEIGLPFIDPMKSLRSVRSTTKKGSMTVRDASNLLETPNISITNSILSFKEKQSSRSSIESYKSSIGEGHFEKLNLSVLKEAIDDEDLEESKILVEETKNEQEEYTNVTIEALTLDEIEKRRLAAQNRYERNKKKI